MTITSSKFLHSVLKFPKLPKILLLAFQNFQKFRIYKKIQNFHTCSPSLSEISKDSLEISPLRNDSGPTLPNKVYIDFWKLLKFWTFWKFWNLGDSRIFEKVLKFWAFWKFWNFGSFRCVENFEVFGTFGIVANFGLLSLVEISKNVWTLQTCCCNFWKSLHVHATLLNLVLVLVLVLRLSLNFGLDSAMFLLVPL